MGWALVFGGWPTVAAWLIAGACVASAWRARSRVELLVPPSAERLMADLVADPGVNLEVAVSNGARRAAVAELNQRISDVAFELGLIPARFAALTRINLASGTALALIAFLRAQTEVPIARVVQGGVCAVSGFVGAGAVATLGRMAKVRVVDVRHAWDRASREVGKALGAPLG